MLRQCWALFQLKWTLLRRSWSRNDFWGFALLGGLSFLGALLSAILGVILYGVGRYVATSSASPLSLLLLLDSALSLYLFFFAWGILIELYRSDLIDFRKMLLLPVALPVIYMMNFAVSLASPLVLFSLPCAVGLLLGLRHGYGNAVFLVGLPMTLLFMTMLGAWAYYLRGRLAIIMENKRHRRILLIALPLCFIALGQLPAVLSHMAVLGKDAPWVRESLPFLGDYLLVLNSSIPLFWPAYGLWAFVNDAGVWILPAVTVGLGLCILLGVRLGYVSTLRHYRGTHGNARMDNSHKRAIPAVRNARPPLTNRRIPGFSEDTAALTLAFYRSYSRHPHVRMLLIMPLCLGLFFLFMYRSGAYGGQLAGEKAWMPMVVLVWPFFNFAFFMFNLFGVDAQSLQGLILMPTPRYKFLLAKNLALAPFVLGLATLFVLLGTLLVQASPRAFGVSLALVLHLYLLFCLVGNYLSLWFPYRISRDALRMPAGRLRMVWVGLSASVMVMVLVAPASLCLLVENTSAPAAAEGQSSLWGAIAALTLLGASLLGYWLSLPHVGDLFTDREQCILARLNHDRE